jgi:hypothetical protein
MPRPRGAGSSVVFSGLWCRGPSGFQWFRGVQRFSGSMVSVVPWFRGSVVPWFSVVQWFQWFRGSQVSVVSVASGQGSPGSQAQGLRSDGSSHLRHPRNPAKAGQVLRLSLSHPPPGSRPPRVHLPAYRQVGATYLPVGRSGSLLPTQHGIHLCHSAARCAPARHSICAIFLICGLLFIPPSPAAGSMGGGIPKARPVPP